MSMAEKPKEICAFCQKGDEAGSLENFSDQNIRAHFDCVIFSPEVITRASQDSQDIETRFDISSVRKEIKRGRKLKCSICKKKGATVGCNEESCRRTYHFPCAKKSKGLVIRDEEKERYIIYCFEHAGNTQDAQNSQAGNCNGTSVTSISTTKRKRKRNSKLRRSNGANKKGNPTRGMHRNKRGSRSRWAQVQTKCTKKRTHNSKSGCLSSDPCSLCALPASSSSAMSPSQKSEIYLPFCTFRKISNQNVKHARTRDHLKDKEASTNNASNGSNPKTTVSPALLKPPDRHGRPPRQIEDQPDDTIVLEEQITYEAEETAPLSGDQEKKNSRIAEPYDGIKQWEDASMTLKIERLKTSILASLATNSKVEDNSRDEDQSELFGSYSESRRNEESSRNEEGDGMQHEMSGSSTESRRNTESYRNEEGDGMQDEMSGSSTESRRNEESSRNEEGDDMQHEMSGSSTESRRNSESYRNEEGDDMQHEMSGSSTESRGNEESSRNEEHDGMQDEMSGSPSESRRNEESSRNEEHDGMQDEMYGSHPESRRNEESSRNKECNGMQLEMSGSSTETSRNEESFRDDEHDGMQCEMAGSSSQSSRKGESSRNKTRRQEDNIDAMQCELYESFSKISRIEENTTIEDCDLAENTRREHINSKKLEILKMLLDLKKRQQIIMYKLQQQDKDGNEGFVRSLVQHLRKVPEDKKLSTEVSILNVVLSVLDQ